jgi:hypothetical protein
MNGTTENVYLLGGFNGINEENGFYRPQSSFGIFKEGKVISRPRFQKEY